MSGARAHRRLRDAFVSGAISVSEFEVAVGRVLVGDLRVVDELLGEELLFGTGVAIPVASVTSFEEASARAKERLS